MNVFELMLLQPRMALMTVTEPISTSKAVRKRFWKEFREAPPGEKRRVALRYGLMLLALSGLGTHLAIKAMFGKKTKTVQFGYRYSIPVGKGYNWEITALSPFNYQYRLWYQLNKPVPTRFQAGARLMNVVKWRENPMWGTFARVVAGQKEGGGPVSAYPEGSAQWARDNTVYIALQTHIYYKKLFPFEATGITKEELKEREDESRKITGDLLFYIGRIAGYSRAVDYEEQKEYFYSALDKEQRKAMSKSRITDEQIDELIATYERIRENIEKYWEKIE